MYQIEDFPRSIKRSRLFLLARNLIQFIEYYFIIYENSNEINLHRLSPKIDLCY